MASPKLSQRRPSTIRALHEMQSSSAASLTTATSTKDGLLQHSRYIRDYLALRLAEEPCPPASELALLNSVFNRIAAVSMTIDLLRYSRIEKALMEVAHTAQECWPVDIVMRAERLLKRWEEELGPEVKDVKQDFFGPGARLETLTSYELQIGEREYESKDRIWWASYPIGTLRPFEVGHSGFEVGSWWLNRAAAHIGGIIGNPTLSITSAAPRIATALVLSGTSEELLDPSDGSRLRYHHTLHEPYATAMCRLLTSGSARQVRLLRSYKLESPIAPKAGVRYDGLYLLKSYGVKLTTPPDEWAYTFLLERVVEDQPPLWTVLSVPNCDQLDDWHDYLRMLVADFGREAAGLAIRDMENGTLTPSSSETSEGSRRLTPSGSDLSSNANEVIVPYPPPDAVVTSSHAVLRSSDGISRNVESREKSKGQKVIEKSGTDEKVVAVDGGGEDEEDTKKGDVEDVALEPHRGRQRVMTPLRVSLQQRRCVALVSNVVVGGELIQPDEEMVASEELELLRLGFSREFA